MVSVAPFIRSISSSSVKSCRRVPIVIGVFWNHPTTSFFTAVTFSKGVIHSFQKRAAFPFLCLGRKIPFIVAQSTFVIATSSQLISSNLGHEYSNSLFNNRYTDGESVTTHSITRSALCQAALFFIFSHKVHLKCEVFNMRCYREHLPPWKVLHVSWLNAFGSFAPNKGLHKKNWQPNVESVSNTSKNWKAAKRITSHV